MLKLRKSVFLLLAAGVLSACSLAPKYERPAAPVAATFPAEPLPASASSAVTVETGWREFFQDPRLQVLVESALTNNRDLRIAALRIEEARAQYNITSADLLPNLNASAGGSRGRTAAATSPLGVSGVTTVYQVGLNLAAFELDCDRGSAACGPDQPGCRSRQSLSCGTRFRRTAGTGAAHAQLARVGLQAGSAAVRGGRIIGAGPAPE
jgi:hypothetical protein